MFSQFDENLHSFKVISSFQESEQNSKNNLFIVDKNICFQTKAEETENRKDIGDLNLKL
jgi:hypothetical protein